MNKRNGRLLIIAIALIMMIGTAGPSGQAGGGGLTDDAPLGDGLSVLLLMAGLFAAWKMRG